MRTLEFFFDYECPYCKRGYEDLMDALKDHPDIEVVWRPTEAHPRPEDHPPHTDLAIEGYYEVEARELDARAYHDRLFKAVHVDRIDVEDAERLVAYVEDLVDPEVVRAVLEDRRHSERREKANDYAYEDQGVWYLPALRMDGQRLDAQGGVGVSREQIEAFLKK